MQQSGTEFTLTSLQAAGRALLEIGVGYECPPPFSLSPGNAPATVSRAQSPGCCYCPDCQGSANIVSLRPHCLFLSQLQQQSPEGLPSGRHVVESRHSDNSYVFHPNSAPSTCLPRLLGVGTWAALVHHARDKAQAVLLGCFPNPSLPTPWTFNPVASLLFSLRTLVR